MHTPPGASPLETASGWIYGGAPVAPAATAETPLAALEAAVEPALRSPPCVVAFSGGRDSSLVLAVAARVARRSGLPLPIPSTLRYPHLPETDESRWQELVVRHLGLEDWLRTELTDELDYVGPLAQAQITRDGPLFPANAHSVVPHVAIAQEGTVMTGLAGDELFVSHRWGWLNDVLARRRRPGRAELPWLAAAALPPGVRARIFARRDRAALNLPWLRPAARRALERHESRIPDDPVRFDRALIASAGSRALQASVATISRIAASGGVELATPLLDPRFVRTLARAGGARGWGNRGATMRAVGGELLPAEVLDRPDKVYFTDVFATETTRAFARRWSGGGLDEELVDPDVLRGMWTRPGPDFGTATLLQAAWLHDHTTAARERPLAEAA